jgi:hypothetical protein
MSYGQRSAAREPEIDLSTPKKAGRPPLPPELKRTARISLRTYPDVAEKAARLGTERMEAIIRRAKEPATATTKEST